jgi:formylglycine-generating enzyme required for sulfatase activity
LAQHAAGLAPSLWQRAERADTPPAERFRALVALAAFDPNDPRWARLGPGLVEQMLRAEVLHLGDWVPALRPVRRGLLPALAESFRGGRLGEFRQVAATVLADYAADLPDELAGLLLEADGKQYPLLRPAAQAQRDPLARLLRGELASHRDEALFHPGLPDPPERIRARLGERARQARRQAAAAALLMDLGHASEVWPLFRHRPDPEVRSHLVRHCGLLDVDPGLLLGRLEIEPDVSARRALVLALGEYGGEHLPPSTRGPLTAKLLAWYGDDPDPGLHAAVDWLLRHRTEGPVPRPLDWGGAQALGEIDRSLARRDPDNTRGWYVGALGHTMIVIRGPVEFRMGSPPADVDRIPETETSHDRRIGRRFALAARPVTVAQFERFLRERPEVGHTYARRYSPEPGCPITSVTWYEAARYCNWLSEREGIPPDQWCYPVEIKPGMKPHPDHLRRTGYRLPTEAEWEFACRAGSVTSRYFGSSVELLPRYAWTRDNADDRTWPVGQKRPNDLGLFDMLGNVWVWAQGPGVYFPATRPGLPVEDAENLRPVDETVPRAMRGGAFSFGGSTVRSASRTFDRPGFRMVGVGLRVARTLP